MAPWSSKPIRMWPPNMSSALEKLAKEGKYDGVAFHRVIDGFMAQTGDVEFGNVKDFSDFRVGTGGSDLPDLQENLMTKNMFAEHARWPAHPAPIVPTVNSLSVLSPLLF